MAVLELNNPDGKNVASVHQELTITLAIASANRREILEEVIPHIQEQTRLPDNIIICAPSKNDIPSDSFSRLNCKVQELVSERGLCRQRNAILAEARDADIVLFLDDDFLMASDYLENLEVFFRIHIDVVMSTGSVLADGILGPGFSVNDGLQILNVSQNSPAIENTSYVQIYNCYGCNMAIRMDSIRNSSIVFDENLPLYGWLEDVDFSRQVAPFGKIVRAACLRGVHLGTKVGRTPGERLGYSQIANPIYLLGKNTMSFRHMSIQLTRNFVANFTKVVRPEPWVDRRGRLRGNMKAVGDLIRGKLSPENVLAME
ncbi:glycosyltransferase family 2 protein [Ahrensia sp. 13_GOM-1096m]|uniref:glycosyltransferase family 2 protein n=1 Tax=Ahrensia sp. 13_GOM-1096m TaxID=1380380 RepID=UPI000ADA6FB1|nr:glycosyltransferase family 2 protein [Ahrensia sp. 13_GOM-1096m]